MNYEFEFLPVPRGPIDRQFWRFHQRHPEVYDELRSMCFRARARGRTRLGIGMLFEVLRWNRIIEGLPDETEDFKLNNNYRSRYARLLMEREPELAGFFSTRRLTT